MPLTGTNTKCQKCVEKCKQWKQVKVIICPYFKDKRRKVPNSKTLLNSSIEKRARQARVNDLLREENTIPPQPFPPMANE
jgi:hypothetical protein